MPSLRARPGLLERFRRGERSAAEEVYWAYVERVEGFVRRSLARAGDRADVGDVVQEVFVRAFAEQGRQAYDGVRDYAPYLLSIARNLLIDRTRKGSRELPTDWLDEAHDRPDEVVAPELWERPEIVAVVERYLAELPAELKALHEERYVRARSQRDTAEVLGISRQTLRTREATLRAGLEERLRATGLLDG